MRSKPAAVEYSPAGFQEDSGVVRVGHDLETGPATHRGPEHVLPAAEESYRTLVEQANDAIVVVQHGKIVYQNPAYGKLLAYPVAEIARCRFVHFIAPEDRQRVQEYSQKQLSGEMVPEQYDMDLRAQDGRRVTVEMKPRVITYQGQPATLMVMRDITERKRGEAATAARIQQMEMVRVAVPEVTRERNLPTLLRLTIEWAVALVEPAVSGVVYLWDQAAQCLIPRAWHGRGEWMQEVRLQLGEGLVGTVAQQRQGLLVNDYQSSPYAHPFFVERLGPTDVLAEPLLYRDQLLGVISLSNEGSALPFTVQASEFLALFTVQAAIAIENARLYHESEDRLKRLGTLVEVAQRLSRGLDLSTVLSTIAEAAAEVFEGEAGFRLLEGEFLVRYGATPGARVVMHKDRIRVGESLSGLVAQSGQAAISQDVASDTRAIPEHRAKVQEERTGALMIVPVRLGDRILGTLNIYRQLGYCYDQNALDLAMSLADQAATAIENAHLFQEVREQAATLAQANAQLNSEIAERQRAEEILAQRAQELARSNAELEQFAYVASHDLQEPLRKIRAFGDRLKATCAEALSDRGDDYVQRMQQAATRMQTLINDLLAYSRVTTKAQPFVPVDLAEVARDVMCDLEVLLEQTGGHVEVEEFPILDADPMQMRQLLQNLVSNALKFRRQEAAPVVKLHGRLLQEQEQGAAGNAPVDVLCQITVADNGIGFDEKYSERIFGVFQRLHGRNHYDGTGVGLAICKKIAERHGGTITAHSTPGQGATFLVTLPVTQPKETTNGYTGKADDHPDGR